MEWKQGSFFLPLVLVFHSWKWKNETKVKRKGLDLRKPEIKPYIAIIH